MIDFSTSTDSELNILAQDIVAEQKRRKEISALHQDAKVAVEQVLLATQSLETQRAGNQFELLLSLLPVEFIDWVMLRGGVQKKAWQQPTDSSTMYMAGDVVVYQGQTYRSIINQNSFSPADAPASWQII